MYLIYNAVVQAVLGRDDCVTVLLEHKASALCRDVQGSTPLHYAASRGYTDILASLAPGAVATDPQDKLLDNKRYTPSHWAAYKGGQGTGRRNGGRGLLSIDGGERGGVAYCPSMGGNGGGGLLFLGIFLFVALERLL